MGIAQGILTNFNFNQVFSIGTDYYGAFSGDIYTVTETWGMPIAFETNIRMLGFVTSQGYTNTDTITMTIYNRTQNTSRSVTFNSWDVSTLNSLALSSALQVFTGDLIYIGFLFNSVNFSDINVTQILAIYDLGTSV